MIKMFNKATSFNQPIEKWDVSNVTYMDRMFYYAKVFNQQIDQWNLAEKVSMDDIFKHADEFRRHNIGQMKFFKPKLYFKNYKKRY